MGQILFLSPSTLQKHVRLLAMWNFTTALCCWERYTASEGADNNGSGQTKISLLHRALNHLATDWELTSQLPTYLKNGRGETEAGTEPFGLANDESRTDE